jgi:polysaccharide export outer membrane protein
MQKLLRFILFSSVLIGLSGCHVLNPSIMFRTKKSYVYTQMQDSLYTSKEYKLSRNDIIDFRIFTNDGFRAIDMTSNSSLLGNNQQANLNYNIGYDDSVKLPVLGRIKLGGMTIRQAEFFLQDKYDSFYVKPYVVLRVQNKRVIIFPGSPGSARVIYLSNNNTKLIEAIALAGGLSENGKAHKIKLIRGDLQNPKVYRIDLSRIEGLRQADMTLQGNDIIYVEPRLNVSRELLKEIAPMISILTSTFLAARIIKTL